VLVLPLVGAVDEGRAERIMETMLSSIVQHRAEVVIIDITGIAAVGLQTAKHLSTAARAGRLLGAQLVLVGMSAEVARTFVEEGIELSGITMLGNLQAGLDYALALRGHFVSRLPTKG
jgi:rsbT co-antagonist protein RsbR